MCVRLFFLSITLSKRKFHAFLFSAFYFSQYLKILSFKSKQILTKTKRNIEKTVRE